jgi:mono/diheme cytochrome c family protein
MKRTILLVLAGALIGAFALHHGFHSFSIRTLTAGFFVPADSVQKGPKIEFNEEAHEFGKIEQNTPAKTTFKAKNIGTDTLEIFSANPSCGCTAAVVGNKKLGPGQSTNIDITFDPHNKAEGPVIKTITVVSNAVNGAQKTLRITGEIFKSKTAHKGDKMSIQGVFAGNCASCHVDKGKGELGAKLYEADCAICHGTKADLKPGPDITSDEMMGHDEAGWKKMIEAGKDNSNMPAFHQKNKGPLNDEEIASLVDYLKAFKKNLMREKSMKNMGGATGTK